VSRTANKKLTKL